MPNPKCRYCDKPAKRKDAVVCISPLCHEKRLKENRERYFAKRKARIANGELVPPKRNYTSELKKPKPKTREINCLRCDQPFTTQLDIDGIPLVHQCKQCRRFCQEYLSFVGVW